MDACLQTAPKMGHRRPLTPLLDVLQQQNPPLQLSLDLTNSLPHQLTDLIPRDQHHLQIQTDELLPLSDLLQ